jgi:selenium-binding protein 1
MPPADREHHRHDVEDGTPASFYASPQEALAAPREDFLYVAALHGGTGVDAPDFIAVVDADPDSETYAQVIHETPMPNVGDELHHYGWNRCSSACHGPDRSHLVVPGFRSSRIHLLNVADDPRRPRLEKVIEPDELLRATGYTRPHTVHCMPGGIVVLSMLGDADGNAPGGFAVLDAHTFEVLGRWERDRGEQRLNSDFWYQPRKNVMVSSEFAEPSAYEKGFDVADLKAGRYGRRLHFWNLERRSVEQTVDLGDGGQVPLEVRWLHDPEAEEGFVGAALSSTMWRWRRENGGWRADQVIAVDPVEQEGWPFPVPGLITDLLVSMDDRFLYFSNWLHGDLRQYDISEPGNPRLTGRLWLGGVLGHPNDAGRALNGGPQMLQLSLDGRRLYVTNSLYSTWDEQFHPGLRSWLLKVDVDPEGGLSVDRDFFVDFHRRPGGPARVHEVRLPGGDCTTEIFP